MSVLVPFHFVQQEQAQRLRIVLPELGVAHPRGFRSESVSPRLPSHVELDRLCLIVLTDGDDLFQLIASSVPAVP
jgi:hypothetical protein